MAKQSKDATIYDRLWDPKEYLKYYYSSDHIAGHIEDDDVPIFEHLISFLKRANRTFSKAIDFGCGPTPHHIFPVVSYAEELHFADYVPENLQEIKNWLEDKSNAHNWDLIIKDILKMEGLNPVSSQEVEKRKKLVREKVTNLKLGDLRNSHPLSDGSVYDLVLSFYCADAATNSKEEWQQYMNNLFNLVQSEGMIFIVSLDSAEEYYVEEKIFPNANVTKDDLHLVLTNNSKFDPQSIEIEVISNSDWAEDGFEGILIAHARAH